MLNIKQQRKILQRISTLEGDIEELKRCRSEIAKCGYASASLSSTGGSKSYTRLDLSKITEIISELTNELKQLRVMLSDGASGNGFWQTVLTIYQ